MEMLLLLLQYIQ